METIPQRKEIAPVDQWNLSVLYPQDSAWQADYRLLTDALSTIPTFRGTLGRSALDLKKFLEFKFTLEQKLERLAVYAYLKYYTEMGNAENLQGLEKVTYLLTNWESALSFFPPELHAVEPQQMESFLKDAGLADYRNALERILRHRPHILSAAEEKLLSQQGRFSQLATKTFDALVDVDISFGTVQTPEGPRPLSQSSFISFLQHSQQEVRKIAYEKFYHAFDMHKNSLAQLLAGSVYQDIYRAEIRHHRSARAAALFSNDVDEKVYDTLIQKVHTHLPSLHRYYEEARRILTLPQLSHYDVYANLMPSIKKQTSYTEAVDIITESLGPLGEDYVATLRKGLTGGWVDKYENQGKRSGAFSSGAYKSPPYILMNYRSDTFDHVFTLAHEAGHSMHSWLASEHNPFQDYQYSIFEAEIASTMNEHLLASHLLANSKSRELRCYLISKQLQDIVATFFRQTMFAEFEHIIHQIAEQGEGLTLEVFRSEYDKLQRAYFGPEVQLPELASLEGLRIPHFYRAFYVYQYATGIAAATCFAHRILSGESPAQYLDFLKRGGSSYPVKNLQLSGVNINDAVDETITVFSSLLDELVDMG